MREKSKHKLLHYLQSSAFILKSDDACVCLYLCGLYWCSPIMCADDVTECVAFAVGAHVVSATLLNSRIYVTCSYAFVFCHVSKSCWFFFLYNSFSSSSSAAAGISGDSDVIQPRPSKPSPALSLWLLGRRAGLLSRWSEDLHATTWESQAEVGDDIWAIRASSSSSSPGSAWSNPQPSTSNTDGIHGR